MTSRLNSNPTRSTTFRGRNSETGSELRYKDFCCVAIGAFLSTTDCNFRKNRKDLVLQENYNSIARRRTYFRPGIDDLLSRPD